MSDINKLQHLIDLVDDNTPEVREAIINELNNYGSTLERDLLEFSDILNPDKMKLIMPAIEATRRSWLLNNWHEWFYYNDYYEKIETALSLISKYQYGIHNKYLLSPLLDELAEEFKNKIPYGDEIDLSNFLFLEKQISGSKEDYYNPYNSNPVYTITAKKGLPITLALIYILIGDRLGFNIKGCNFPGHFLAKAEIDNEIILIDCFNGGKIFFETEIQNILNVSHKALSNIIYYDPSPETIIRRVLNNLINSYSIINDTQNQNLFSDLLKITPL